MLMTLHVISFCVFPPLRLFSPPVTHSTEFPHMASIPSAGQFLTVEELQAVVQHLCINPASLNPQLLSAAVKLIALASLHYPQAGDPAMSSPVSDSSSSMFAGTHVFILAASFWVLPDVQSCWRRHPTTSGTSLSDTTLSELY